MFLFYISVHVKVLPPSNVDHTLHFISRLVCYILRSLLSIYVMRELRVLNPYLKHTRTFHHSLHAVDINA